MKTFFFTIISLPVYLVILTFTFLTVLFVLFLSIFKFNKAIIGSVNFWAKGIFVIIFKRLHIIGKEKIDKKNKYILVANHGSLFDIMAVMSLCPNVSWLGKAKLMKVPLFKNALKAINYVPLNNTDLKKTKEIIGKLIQNSGYQTIAIFPEGTRTLNGDFSKFKKGFTYIYKATMRDILPVTLNGFYKLKPKNRFYIDFFSKLEVKINDVIKSTEIEDFSNEQIVEKVEKSLLESYKN